MSTSLHIENLPTPSLLLDEKKLEQNIKRLSGHIGSLGGILRPHVKTHKSIDVTRKLLQGGNMQGITVSTLREADYFFDNGINDILYAVGIAPNKLDHAQALIEAGCDLKIILDSPEAAQRVATEGRKRGVTFNVLVELDTDGHRSGLSPEGDELLATANTLHNSQNTVLLGVMTHAGESYHCNTPQALSTIARQERDLSLLAASRLRNAGLPCPVVSIGSTPTAFAIDDLRGITEVRAGVYTFFDLVMCGIGVCTIDEIAVSVLSSVIGFQHEKNWIITDSGWMAMSRDRGTARQAIDYGYGLVKDIDGRAVSDMIVSNANQEHGIISRRVPGHDQIPADVNIGSLIRILPNHACSTASQYSKYYVIRDNNVIAEWPRINGW